MTTGHHAGVIAFYDAHPINEHEILRKVEGTGADLAALTENDRPSIKITTAVSRPPICWLRRATSAVSTGCSMSVAGWEAPRDGWRHDLAARSRDSI